MRAYQRDHVVLVTERCPHPEQAIRDLRNLCNPGARLGMVHVMLAPAIRSLADVSDLPTDLIEIDGTNHPLRVAV